VGGGRGENCPRKEMNMDERVEESKSNSKYKT